MHQRSDNRDSGRRIVMLKRKPSTDGNTTAAARRNARGRSIRRSGATSPGIDAVDRSATGIDAVDRSALGDLAALD